MATLFEKLKGLVVEAEKEQAAENPQSQNAATSETPVVSSTTQAPENPVQAPQQAPVAPQTFTQADLDAAVKAGVEKALTERQATIDAAQGAAAAHNQANPQSSSADDGPWDEISRLRKASGDKGVLDMLKNEPRKLDEMFAGASYGAFVTQLGGGLENAYQHGYSGFGGTGISAAVPGRSVVAVLLRGL